MTKIIAVAPLGEQWGVWEFENEGAWFLWQARYWGLWRAVGNMIRQVWFKLAGK